MSAARSTRIAPYLLIAPFAICFLLFFTYPLVNSIALVHETLSMSIFRKVVMECVRATLDCMMIESPLPLHLPEPVVAVTSDAIHLLIDYQSPSYAHLYVDRLRRFIGKQGVDDAMLTDIARLMAVRMSYEDPIRIAQLKLIELDGGPGASA